MKRILAGWQSKNAELRVCSLSSRRKCMDPEVLCQRDVLLGPDDPAWKPVKVERLIISHLKTVDYLRNSYRLVH